MKNTELSNILTKIFTMFLHNHMKEMDRFVHLMEKTEIVCRGYEVSIEVDCDRLNTFIHYEKRMLFDALLDIEDLLEDKDIFDKIPELQPLQDQQLVLKMEGV